VAFAGDEAFDKRLTLRPARFICAKLSGKGRHTTAETAIVVCENGVRFSAHLGAGPNHDAAASEEFIGVLCCTTLSDVACFDGRRLPVGFLGPTLPKIEGRTCSILGLPLLPLLDLFLTRGGIAS